MAVAPHLAESPTQDPILEPVAPKHEMEKKRVQSQKTKTKTPSYRFFLPRFPGPANLWFSELCCRVLLCLIRLIEHQVLPVFFVFGRQFYRVIFCRYPRKSPAGACGRREVEKKKRTSTPRGLFCFFSLAPRRPPAEEEQAVEEEEGRRHERGESFELMARSSSRSAAQWNVDVHSLRPPRQKTRGVGAV